MSNVDDIAYQGVEIHLDKVRHLHFKFRGIKIIVEKYGSIQKAVEVLQKTFQGAEKEIDVNVIDAISVLTYAGLVHEDKDLTQDDVEDILDFRNIAELPGKLIEALSNSLPQVEGGKFNPQPARKKK